MRTTSLRTTLIYGIAALTLGFMLALGSIKGVVTADADLSNLGNLIATVSISADSIQKQFGTIFENATAVNEQENVIKNAMQEQNAGSQQILDAIAVINSIQAVSQMSKESSQSISNVSAAIDKFKV